MRRPRSRSVVRVQAMGYSHPLATGACPKRLVERQIQLEHVDARAAEQPERRPFGVGRTSARTARDRAPRARATRATWISAASGGMCGIHPAAARRHHLRRHLLGGHALFRHHRRQPLSHGLELVGVRRPVVGAAGRRGVVVHCGRPRMEVLGPRELLRDQRASRRRCRRRAGSGCLRPGGKDARPMPQSTSDRRRRRAPSSRR